MQRSICLVRQCMGLSMRIECEIRPVVERGSGWLLLCAAGMSGAQPTSIRVQGPIDGAQEAQRVLWVMHESLRQQGYQEASDGHIWRLRLLAEWRRYRVAHELGGDCSP